MPTSEVLPLSHIQTPTTSAPPAPWSESADPPSGSQRFHLRVQKVRALTFTVAAIAASIAHTSGFVQIDIPAALGVLAFGYATALAFFGLCRTRWARKHAHHIAPTWIACDIGMVTCLVYLTGGVASPWFLWYLACAGAAALVGGLSWVIVVAVTSAAAYLFILVAMGDIGGIDSGLYYAVAQISFLFGASTSLIVGTAKLRRDHAKIKRFQEREAIKVWELSLLAAELDAANAQLRDTTVTDPLTGLHNRRFLQERMSVQMDRRGGAARTTSGVLIVDLDHFKRVNDTHGHRAGDQVLCHVARLLRSCVRGGDSVVRWGGEEFLVLLAGAVSERTAEIVRRILESVRSEPLRLEDGSSLSLSCSIGWSEFRSREAPGSGATWDRAVEHADQALYMAKTAGRDRACAVLPGSEDEESRQPAPPTAAGGNAEPGVAIRTGPVRIAARG